MEAIDPETGQRTGKTAAPPPSLLTLFNGHDKINFHNNAGAADGLLLESTKSLKSI